MKRVRFFFGGILSALVMMSLAVLVHTAASAAATTTAPGNFSLQVTPSPLVSTIKPGETTTLDLKIRNASTAPEVLRIQARAFKFDNTSGEAVLDENKQPEIAQWLKFSAPVFTVQPGEWYTQKVIISLPEDTGFSYSFALQLTRKDAPAATAGRQLTGSIAVFTLLNVDRPGATRKVELGSFTSSQKIYEYLPATLDVRLKNTGNTIVQPYGNVYVQRDSKSTNSISTLPVNQNQAYLLPNTERSLKATWSDGFPVYQTKVDSGGNQVKNLKWNFDKVSHFRFGKYTAKVVAVYNDGKRDVPVSGEVTFWVIPWKALLGLVAALVTLIFAFRWLIRTRTEKAVKRALNAQKKE